MHHIILTMLVLLRVVRTQTGELRDFRFGSCLVFFPGFMGFGLQLNWEPHLTKKKEAAFSFQKSKNVLSSPLKK